MAPENFKDDSGILLGFFFVVLVVLLLASSSSNCFEVVLYLLLGPLFLLLELLEVDFELPRWPSERQKP